jgi:hypothetical protein
MGALADVLNDRAASLTDLRAKLRSLAQAPDKELALDASAHLQFLNRVRGPVGAPNSMPQQDMLTVLGRLKFDMQRELAEIDTLLSLLG